MSRRWCEVRPPLMILLRLGFHHGILEAHVKEFHEHVESFLEDPLNCANIGWSNNTIRELEERWSVLISFFRYLTYNFAAILCCWHDDCFQALIWPDSMVCPIIHVGLGLANHDPCFGKLSWDCRLLQSTGARGLSQILKFQVPLHSLIHSHLYVSLFELWLVSQNPSNLNYPRIWAIP